PGVGVPGGSRGPRMSGRVPPCRRVGREEILIAADSSSFSARCFSLVRSSVRSRRYRVCSRITQNSSVATKHGVTAPRSKHAASHRESAGSSLGPPGQALDLLGISQHAFEPPNLPPLEL